MLTITAQEAEGAFSQYLAAVENGEEIMISRDQKPIAKIVPIESGVKPPRPKVGETIDPPFEIPDSAFAPLTDEELKEWGL
jgi:prevent-host-death family protein